MASERVTFSERTTDEEPAFEDFDIEDLEYVYSDTSVITNEQDQKLSKQNQAPALNNNTATDNLRCALHFLHQPQPPSEASCVESLLTFAVDHWTPQRIPAVTAITASSVDIKV